jgi:hypothetical protein
MRRFDSAFPMTVGVSVASRHYYLSLACRAVALAKAGPLNFFFRITNLHLASTSAGEPRWLRVQFRDGGTARPLEPDAGNAAEGSEGPMPDWDFQPCDFSRLAFCEIYESGKQERRKTTFCFFDFLFSCFPNLTSYERA